MERTDPSRHAWYLPHNTSPSAAQRRPGIEGRGRVSRTSLDDRSIPPHGVHRARPGYHHVGARLALAAIGVGRAAERTNPAGRDSSLTCSQWIIGGLSTIRLHCQTGPGREKNRRLRFQRKPQAAAWETKFLRSNESVRWTRPSRRQPCAQAPKGRCGDEGHQDPRQPRPSL